MTTLSCPKCRQGITDDSLDAGQCPACGFPLDGPVVLANPGKRSYRLLIALGAIAIVAVSAIAGYAILNHSQPTQPQPEFVEKPTPEEFVVHIAPFPHEPKRVEPESVPVEPRPTPKPEPTPVVVEEPPKKKDGPRPIGVVMKVDPKIAPVRHFDHPDDIAAIPDLNSNDRIVLTGKLRALRIGSVNGKGSIDASGLVAEEIIITGDLNSEASVKLNAPNGKVTVGGFVAGSTKLIVVAAGGEVLIAKSARVTGGSVLTVTTKRLEAQGTLSGGTKVNVTVTAGGSMKFTLMDEGATVTFRKAALKDPKVIVERGELRGGANVREIEGQ